MGREHIQNPRLQLFVGDVRKIHKVFPVRLQWGAGWRPNWAGAFWRRWRFLRSDRADLVLGLRTPWLDLGVWGGLLEVVLRKWRRCGANFDRRNVQDLRHFFRGFSRQGY